MLTVGEGKVRIQSIIKRVTDVRVWSAVFMELRLIQHSNVKLQNKLSNAFLWLHRLNMAQFSSLRGFTAIDLVPSNDVQQEGWMDGWMDG